MKKIIIYNLLGLFIVFICLEIIAFSIATKIESTFIGNEAFKHVLTRYIVKPTYIYYDVPSPNARPIADNNFKKKPILLFGCSVTYGNKLSDEENFSGQLSKITKRPVYNLAYDGWTISHMLRQLEKNENIKNLNPEYIIYTYISDQRRRLFFYQGWVNDTELYLRYTYNKNNELIANEKNYPFYYRLQIVKNIQHLIERNKINNEEYASNFMLDIFKRSSKIMKERYPNAKLIMLIYHDYDCEYGDNIEISNTNAYFSDKEYKKLTEMGFDLINMEEFANKVYCTPEYRLDDKHHPSENMWKDFIPLLVKKYKM